jgi:hypothetical protein
MNERDKILVNKVNPPCLALFLNEEHFKEQHHQFFFREKYTMT